MLHTTALEDRPPAHVCSAVGRAAWQPAFIADWAEATFVHFAVEPRFLQSAVPFPLDLYDGRAYVSLVAFTMQRMRPAQLDSRAGEWLLRPIMPCRFLNVRTYVRAGGSDGIYFLGEWLSQWANIPLGPLLYGLPYRAGRLRFNRDETRRSIEIEVRGLGGARLAFHGQAATGAPLSAARAGSLDAFLLERYLAFTTRRGKPLAFCVEHDPWQTAAAEISLTEMGLLHSTGDWASHAQLAGGNYTPGAFSVGMGLPRPVAYRHRARSAFVG